MKCFTIFRTHKYSTHFCIIPSLNILYCYILSSDFFCLIQRIEYMICLTLLSKFSDVLLAFTCARAIGNLWSIYLEVNILGLDWSEFRLFTSSFCLKYFGFKSIKNSLFLSLSLSLSFSLSLSLPSQSAYKFLRVSFFFGFFSGSCGFTYFLKFKVSINKSL